MSRGILSLSVMTISLNMTSAFISTPILLASLCFIDLLKLFVQGITSNPDCLIQQHDRNFSHPSEHQLTIDQARSHCNGSLQDACFWYTFGDQTLQVEEEKESPFLFVLGSPELCQGDLIYSVENGSNSIKLVSSTICSYTTWSINSLSTLDRELEEVVGPFTLQCTNGAQSVTMTFSVNITDINDNSPTLPLGERSLDKSLLAIDRDLPAVNEYGSELLGGLPGTLRLSISKRSIPLERGIIGTGLYCDVNLKENQNSSLHINGVLRITDTNQSPRYVSQSVDVPVSIYYDETRKTVICERSLPFSAKIKRSHDVASVNVNAGLYPREPVLLSIKATPYTKVVEPNNVRSLGAYKFRLNNYKQTFNITEAHGIVFLDNTDIFFNNTSSVNLNVSWVGPRNGSTVIKVIVSSNEVSPCATDRNNIHFWQTCAENANEKKCTQSCGIGTGVMKNENDTIGCHWKTPMSNNSDLRAKSGPRNSNSGISYYTCVANPETCPDGWCDPYEELDPRLCPQDCTIQKLSLHYANGAVQGLGRTAGLCTCDSFGVCSCAHLNMTNQIKSNKTSKNRVSSSPTLTQISEDHTFAGKHVCGTACLSAVMTICIILSAIITLVVCKIVRENAKNNLKLDNIHIHSTDTLITLDPVATPAETAGDHASAIPIDQEWEFPRERMKIDFCLGEGEFGKVLKAQAMNIAGFPGVTTVAVKTLKDGAGEAELADLLSEYQMLKELSHPNVIKLLGASTSPGGPVYLIMEFASHGSLKSYLRRHRPLDSAHNPDLEARLMNEHSVTPKDILSFAWQIAKGMAYLSDMKLVHRDLAARNILVATGKVCKISDFGLTRDIYEDETYLKRSKGRVPVKWMALESLSDHIYTSKSDVWGFGILLWELVTLGSSPYPGVAVQNLFYLLKSGYRMEKPRNCSHQLYEMMRSCWGENPAERPAFHQLRNSLESMLEDGTDYLDLDGFFVFNRLYFSELLLQKDADNSFDTENANNNFNGDTDIRLANMENDKSKGHECDTENCVAHYTNENVTLNSYKNFPFAEVDSKLANVHYVNSK